jgi:hypothetical protein
MPMGIWMVACSAIFSLASGGRVLIGGFEAAMSRENGTASDEIVQDVKRHEYSQSDAASVASMDNSQDLRPKAVAQAISKFFVNASRKLLGEKTTAIKLMSLNVEFFTETCDKGFSKGIEYCLTTRDTTCTNTVTQMLCCNSPNKVLRGACRNQGCFDVGHPDDTDPSSGIWPAYTKEGDRGNVTKGTPLSQKLPVLPEPRCLQGARNLLQQVVQKHSPDVVATQEDFENYPLMVPGYVTIISANSHDMWYASPPFEEPQSWLKLMDKKRNPVHMVNALLVREKVFNKEETQKLCTGDGRVYEEIETGKFYRCGLDLQSPEAAAKKAEMVTGSEENPQLYGWENAGDQTKPKPMPTKKDRILLMASRCAALAVVNVGSGVEHIAIASAHLTGGRFDDDLIGLKKDYSAYEEIQKEEKIRQALKLAHVLAASGKPSIIMGDFNGPDDFDIQWWKVLTTPWPATHPFLGSVFGGKAGNHDVLGPISKLAKDDEFLRRLHTDNEESYWNSDHIKSTLGNDWEEKKGALARFEGVYKRWMVGVHEELKNLNWEPLATSQDFTKSFGKDMGTTSKFGGMVDFFYASPDFVKDQECALPSVRGQVDFSNGEIHEVTRVKTCKRKASTITTGIASSMAQGGSGIVSAMDVSVVHGVLKRSTDHAPVIATLKIR